jgi:hypothetical protein
MSIRVLPPTDRQKIMEAEVVKAFVNRNYNNCINHQKVITGAEKKSRKTR